MTTPKTVWVIRHALREDMHPVQWCDAVKHMVDPDLQPLGLEMSRRLADRLAGESIDHLISSPFMRTLRTAGFLASKLQRQIKVEYGFHEMLDPKWFPEGVPVLPDLRERAKVFPAIDLSYASRVRPAGMEPPGDPACGIRVGKAIEAVLAQLPGSLAIVTHYAVCNGLHHWMTGDYVSGFIELTSISKYVQLDGRWTVAHVADASHLQGMRD